MRTGYIYVLWDKNENDIYYVGSSVNPKLRAKQHALENRYYDEVLDKKFVKDDTAFNYSIIDEMMFDERTEDLLKLEIYWIHQFKQWGFNLKNRVFYHKRQFNDMPTWCRQYICKIERELFFLQKRRTDESFNEALWHIVREHKDFCKQREHEAAVAKCNADD